VLPAKQLSASRWLIAIGPPGEPASPSNIALVHRLRKVPTNLRAVVGGPAARNADQASLIAENLPPMMIVLGVAMMGVLFLMTGSVVLPIKALLMNPVSVAAALGLLVVIFQNGWLDSLFGFHSLRGLENSQAVLPGAIALG
jgi:putative drug exporter of the RND superfamily